MASAPNLLGEYLRARRELVTPDQVGLPVLASRRVPGLRREEVAILAGISAEYYLRLEQGRDRNPSAQVLRSLARVLQLEDDSHLLSLASDRPSPRRRPGRRESAPPSTARLIDLLPLPAFIEGRHLDVLASNALARALSRCLVPGRNRLRDVFTDPDEQALFSDWERAAEALLAGFRRTIGSDVDDDRVVDLVGELSLTSPDFRTMWARHDIGPRSGAALSLDHPDVGTLDLDREKLLISDTDGIMLVIYHPRPDTQAAEKLALLGSLASDPEPQSMRTANRSDPDIEVL